jgi:ribosome assembly protein YihI (activator of Der GTPase)
MKGVRNEAVNRLWKDNAPKIYQQLLQELYESQKIDDLLNNLENTEALEKRLTEWSASVIDLTESHFNTFGFTMLHYELACILH